MAALAVLVVVIMIFKENCMGPFATGTKNAAFLGTTFGMSPQEANRALKKEGAQLVSYDEFKRLDGTYKTNIFDYIYSSQEEERIHSDSFMPPIEMFDCSTEGRFVFRKDRLLFVEIFFKTYSISNAEALVEKVKSRLLAVYPSASREDSDYIPSAYYLRFASDASIATLWVNLSNSTNLIVNLSLGDLKSQQERKNQLKQREEKAFGAGR